LKIVQYGRTINFEIQYRRALALGHVVTNALTTPEGYVQVVGSGVSLAVWPTTAPDGRRWSSSALENGFLRRLSGGVNSIHRPSIGASTCWIPPMLQFARTKILASVRIWVEAS